VRDTPGKPLKRTRGKRRGEALGRRRRNNKYAIPLRSLGALTVGRKEKSGVAWRGNPS